MISLSNFVKKLRRDLMENRETGDTRESEEKKETKAKKKKGYFAFNVGQLLCLLVSST